MLFERLEDSANCEDLATEAFSAASWALEDVELVAKLSETAAFAVRLLSEEAVKLASNVAALLLLLVSETEAFLVALADNAPPDAVALLLAVPVVFDVLPPPEDVLLLVELPTDPAVPSELAAARFAVLLKAPVALFACVLLAVAPNDASSDLLEVFVSDPFAAKAFVVALALLELEDSEAASDAVKSLLALACCIWSLVWLNVVVELLVLELSLVYDLLSVVEWFSEVSRLEEKLLVFVTFELLSTVSWVFFPRW